jgi:hypothetical protein
MMDIIGASGEMGEERGKSFVEKTLRQHRYVINIVLACVAVALEVYYSICGGSCSYLRGDLIGIPLQYVGIGYMIVIVFLNILRTDIPLLMLLSAGVGIELYLVGFQLWYHTYCPYCLAFGGVVLVLFLLNLNRTRKWLTIISMTLALILFFLFFEGSVTPSYSGDFVIPTFGEGKANVRLYTDYFCPPCRAMEPDAEPLLAELVKKNKIALTFIDTPLYQYSSLYARYYLYAMNEKRNLNTLWQPGRFSLSAQNRMRRSPPGSRQCWPKKASGSSPSTPRSCSTSWASS